MPDELKGGRLCQFFNQSKGCIKGDRCEFQHLILKPGQAPPIIVKDKICEYFLKPRGCNKGKDCDFQHPDLEENEKWTLRMQLAPKSIPCQFFGTSRGCIKGDTCDFLHSPGAGGGGGVVGGGPIGDGATNGGFLSEGLPPRICKYFGSPEGCFTGMDCEFAHITQEMLALSNLTGGLAPTNSNNIGSNTSSVVMTAAGPMNKMGVLMQPVKCEFFLSPSGCPKQAMCEFVHQKQKPCEYLLSARGCRKGLYCDFMHTDMNGNPLTAPPGGSAAEGGGLGKIAKPSVMGARPSPY